MSSVILSGDTSGTITVSAPAVAGSNTVTLPAATGELSMLGGSGQTWQNLTSSRALGTTYTNSTGKPIEVNVRIIMNTAGAYPTLTIDGVVISGSAYPNASNSVSVIAIVPNGSSYVAGVNTGTSTLGYWAELR